MLDMRGGFDCVFVAFTVVWFWLYARLFVESGFKRRGGVNWNFQQDVDRMVGCSPVQVVGGQG